MWWPIFTGLNTGFLTANWHISLIIFTEPNAWRMDLQTPKERAFHGVLFSSRLNCALLILGRNRTYSLRRPFLVKHRSPRRRRFYIVLLHLSTDTFWSLWIAFVTQVLLWPRTKEFGGLMSEPQRVWSLCPKQSVGVMVFQLWVILRLSVSLSHRRGW